MEMVSFIPGSLSSGMMRIADLSVETGFLRMEKSVMELLQDVQRIAESLNQDLSVKGSEALYVYRRNLEDDI